MKLEREIKEIGETADAADEEQRALLLQVPNTPHADCPVGEDESANPVLREWGEQPSFDGFEARDHVALGEDLGLFSFELGAKISGSGFITFTGPGAKLERALIQFLLDQHTRDHGYSEVSPPFVIKRDCMFGTGQLPKFEDDMYALEEGAAFSRSDRRSPGNESLSGSDFKRRRTAHQGHGLHTVFSGGSGISGPGKPRHDSHASV